LGPEYRFLGIRLFFLLSEDMMKIKVVLAIPVLLGMAMLGWFRLPSQTDHLLTMKGGHGSCFWNQYPSCSATGMCTGCTPDGNGGATCDMPTGQLKNRFSYSECVNTVIGLLECGFPTTIHCVVDFPCDPDCDFRFGGFSCLRSVDEDGNLIETEGDPHDETSASGGTCGGDIA
jgi:hypothetical protein